MADIFDIQTGRRVPITTAEYMGMIDTMLKYFHEARKTRGRSAFRASEEILIHVRFSASYSQAFREATRDDMREVMDILYEDINGE